MVNWTKKGLLGGEQRFLNKYQKPIMAGMATDCTQTEAESHEQLSAELHKTLSSIVHRCSRDVLRRALPFRQDVVIHIRQSKSQAKVSVFVSTNSFLTIFLSIFEALQLSCIESSTSIRGKTMFHSGSNITP